MNEESTMVITKEMCVDTFYGEALALNEDGSTQRILRIKAIVNGAVVAFAEAGYLSESRGGHLSVLNVNVKPEFRRQGIASKMYDLVSDHFNDNVLPYPGNEGGSIQHFWLNRLKSQPNLLHEYSANIGVPRHRIQSVDNDSLIDGPGSLI